MSKSKPSEVQRQKRRNFDPDFKRRCVTLARDIGFRQAATDLGVGESNLRNWSKEIDRLGSQAFLPVQQRTDYEAEVKRLREENRRLKMERDILKKAAIFLAKDDE